MKTNEATARYEEARDAAQTCADLSAAVAEYRDSPGYSEGHSVDVWEAPGHWIFLCDLNDEDYLLRSPAGEIVEYDNTARTYAVREMMCPALMVHRQMTWLAGESYDCPACCSSHTLGEMLAAEARMR